MKGAETGQPIGGSPTAPADPAAVVDVDTLLARARNEFESGDLISAHGTYLEILDRHPDHPDALHVLGAVTRELGRPEEGTELIREAIRANPRNPAYHNTLGNILVNEGRFEPAIECFRQAIALTPDFLAAHSNLGQVLHRTGRLSEAVASYGRALEINPDLAEIHINLGSVLSALGDIDDAETHLEKAIASRPDLPGGWINLGLLREQQHRPDDAMTCYRRAVETNSGNGAAHVMMARLWGALDEDEKAASSYHEALLLEPSRVDARIALANLLIDHDNPADAAEQIRCALEYRPNDATLHARHAEHLIAANLTGKAEKALSRAIELAPENHDFWMRLGSLLRAENRADDAIPIYQSILALDPDSAAAHCELGIAEIQRGRAGDAAERFRRAIELRPDFAEAHNNLANLLQELGGHEEAIEAYRRAIDYRPDFAEAHYNLGQLLLLLGRYREGWAEYDWRLHIEGAKPRAEELSPWQGEPLTGHRTAIVSEQGPGDVVMFAHCLPDLLAEVADATLHVEPRLSALIARSFPDAKVTTRKPQPPDADAAMTIAIGSLPRLYRQGEASFSGRACRYLRPDPEAVARWHERYDELGPGLKVGISWRGGKTVTERRLRQTPIENWLPILQLPDMCFVSLQYGDCAEEIARLRGQWGISIADWDDADPVADLDGFAAQIDALDYVVSIANTTAHFAGALAKPTHLLVPAAPSWRWQLERDGSPWYPSLTLFRQKTGEPWNETTRRAADAIARKLDREPGVEPSEKGRTAL